MTFVLKELSELRRHFDDTVDIILRREKKGKIEDLANPRKYELQFLASILAKLEEQVRQKPQKGPSATTVNYSVVFYGAMLVVMKDIDNNRGLMDGPGLLHGRLEDAIGFNDRTRAEDKPSLFQIAKFYTALNGFMNQIFVDNDSRKGFAKDHMLHAVPTDNLHQLIKTSYKLEQFAQKAIIASLPSDGKTTVNVGDYKQPKSCPASATERFGGFAKLNDDLDSLVKEELAKKSLPTIESLSIYRAAQLHFLKAIKDSLKTSTIDDAEKVAILAGAMHLVRKQIEAEYASSYVTSSDNSIIHTGLDKLLGGDEVSPQDTEALITSAIQFARFMTVEPQSSDKKAIREVNIFSAIPSFDLKGVFNLFIDMIYACRTQALKHVVEEFKKESKPVEKVPTGYLGSLSSALGALSLFGAKKADPTDDEEDDELEHKTSADISH